MKTIGILGGVGPETTSHVYHSIINLFRKSQLKRYPSIVIYNLPFPFVIEKEVIIDGINSHKMIPYLIRGAKILEKAGADFGILPCNTLHKYIERIRRVVKIPFLSILDESASRLRIMRVKTVGILATETTAQDKLYDKILREAGINVLYPTRREQDEINRIIVEILNGKKTKLQKGKIRKICSSLYKRGVGAILLACTDLQIITSHIHTPALIIDTTEILIRASVRELTSK
jgi:aspartate racemase